MDSRAFRPTIITGSRAGGASDTDSARRYVLTITGGTVAALVRPWRCLPQRSGPGMGPTPTWSLSPTCTWSISKTVSSRGARGRLAARRDQNEPEIRRALEAVGAIIFDMDEPADLLVRFRGSWFVLEVKVAKGKLTAAQVEARELLDSRAIPVVRTAAEAWQAIGAAVR